MLGVKSRFEVFKNKPSSTQSSLQLYWFLLCCWRNEHISTFSFCVPGAEDVVMAFSRSETEDRRQWPRPRPHTHYPAMHVIHNDTRLHKHKTDELRRRGACRGAEGEDAADAASPSTQNLFDFVLSSHHYLKHALEWVTVGRSLGSKAICENTQIAWMICFFS